MLVNGLDAVKEVELRVGLSNVMLAANLDHVVLALSFAVLAREDP